MCQKQEQFSQIKDITEEAESFHFPIGSPT